MLKNFKLTCVSFLSRVVIPAQAGIHVNPVALDSGSRPAGSSGMTKWMRSFSFLIAILVASQVLCGCFGSRRAAVNKYQPRKVIPRILVLPFACPNSEISKKMTEGFVDDINKKIPVITEDKFEIHVTSMARMAALRKLSLDGGRERDRDRDREREPEPEKPDFLVAFSSNSFFREVARKEAWRNKLYLDYDVYYVVLGAAREKKLSSLEMGNLVTADSADIRILDVKTGQIFLEDYFRQGDFQVLAPDHIGSKFADKFNKKYKQVLKDAAKKEKEFKKRVKKIGGQQ